MDLKHTTLYAKGWYLKTDLVEDLKKTLNADGYIPDHAGDIINILIQEITPYWVNVKKRDAESLLRQVLSDADPVSSWKVGYHEDSSKHDYRSAIIHSFLSILSCSTVDDLGGLPEADYTILPKHYDKVMYSIEDDEYGDNNIAVTPCEYAEGVKVGSVHCKTHCPNFVAIDENIKLVTCKGVMLNEKEKD